MIKKYILPGIACIAFSIYACTPSVLVPAELSGTTWEIYQYKDEGITQPLALADTIQFFNEPSCTYNGVNTNYRILDVGGNQSLCRLQIDNSAFGNISGIVPVSAIEAGTIFGETFNPLPQGTARQLWIRKISE